MLIRLLLVIIATGAFAAIIHYLRHLPAESPTALPAYKAPQMERAQKLYEDICRDINPENRQAAEDRLKKILAQIAELLELADKIRHTVAELEQEVAARTKADLSEEVRRSLASQLEKLQLLKERERELLSNVAHFIILMETLHLSILQAASGDKSSDTMEMRLLLDKLEESGEQIAKESSIKRQLERELALN